jgi:hypothetical protein
MSSFLDLNLPMILFAARPADSRKGLQTFLDAIDCLAKLEDLPAFGVWIVGGTNSELTYIRSMVKCRHTIADWLKTGMMFIWGRMAHEALPEIYSRSMVVVMPSSREQFGLVAAEAMMCGLPVVANSVGGLVDAIIDGVTGNLLERNDSGLLANVLAGYLRNSSRRDFYSGHAREWARFAFARDTSYSNIELLYNRQEPEEILCFPSHEVQRQSRMAILAEECAVALGEPVLRVKDLSSGAHLSFRIETENGSYFVKAYALEPSMNACVFGTVESLSIARTFDEYAGKCRFHENNDGAPQPIMYMPNASMIIFEWNEPLTLSSAEHEREAIVNVASRYREYKPLEDTTRLSTYMTALRGLFAQPCADNLAIFDLAGADLNAHLCGGVRRFMQTHPQAELLRYRLRLARHCWVLPDSFLARTRGMVEYLLSLHEGIAVSPLMRNGSLKVEHLLKAPHGIVACDIDSCRYAVGPLDEAHYLFKNILRNGWGPAAAIGELRAMISDEVEQYLGVCWIVVYLVYEALARLTEGKCSAAEVLMRFSHGFFQACHESFGYDKAKNAGN